MLKNFIYLLSDKILRMILGFIMNIMYIEYFTPSILGKWNYTTSFIAIGTAIALFSGIDNLVISKVARVKDDEISVVMGSTFFIRLISTIAAVIGCISISFFVNDTEIHNLVIICSIALIPQVFHSLEYLFQGKLLPKYGAMVRNIVLVLLFLIKIFLIKFAIMTIPMLCWIMVIESLLIGAGYLLLAKLKFRNLHLFFWNIDNVYIKSLFSTAIFLLLSGVLSVSLSRFSVLQINAFIDTKNVAVYSFMLFIFESFLMVLYTVSNTFFPTILQDNVTEPKYWSGVSTLIKRQLILLLTMGVATYIGYTIFKEFIFSMIDQEYRNSFTLLIYAFPLCLLTLVNFIVLQYVLIPLKATLFHLIRISFGFLTLFSVNILLIPKLGIIGAIYSSIFAQAVMLIFVAIKYPLYIIKILNSFIFRRMF